MGNSEQEVEKAMQEWENSLDDMEFIWGIKSGDDLCNCECNLYTMNDFCITYFKNTKKYAMSVETIYLFENKNDERKYIKSILDKFTTWMSDNNYDTSKKLSMVDLFTEGVNINTEFDSIEDLYATFKIYADTFIGG